MIKYLISKVFKINKDFLNLNNWKLLHHYELLSNILKQQPLLYTGKIHELHKINNKLSQYEDYSNKRHHTPFLKVVKEYFSQSCSLETLNKHERNLLSQLKENRIKENTIDDMIYYIIDGILYFTYNDNIEVVNKIKNNYNSNPFLNGLSKLKYWGFKEQPLEFYNKRKTKIILNYLKFAGFIFNIKHKIKNF